MQILAAFHLPLFLASCGYRDEQNYPLFIHEGWGGEMRGRLLPLSMGLVEVVLPLTLAFQNITALREPFKRVDLFSCSFVSI